LLEPWGHAESNRLSCIKRVFLIESERSQQVVTRVRWLPSVSAAGGCCLIKARVSARAFSYPTAESWIPTFWAVRHCWASVEGFPVTARSQRLPPSPGFPCLYLPCLLS